MQEHETETVESPWGERVEIDSEIVQVVRKAWDLGLRSYMSCQQGGLYSPWITFFMSDWPKFFSLLDWDKAPSTCFSARGRRTGIEFWINSEGHSLFTFRFADPASGLTCWKGA